jgi:hypothetical protein
MSRTKQPPITDDALIAITDQHIRAAMGYMGGKLSEARRRNVSFYLAKAEGELAPPQIEGRSQVVSTDVADTVEWMLPSLLKIFTAGDQVVEFVPRRQEDEEAAKQATDFANYVFYRQNPGFQLIYTWFKDALIEKVGVLKVVWDADTEDARESYRDLTTEQMSILAQDKAVEIIEHTERIDEQAAAAMAQALAQQQMQPQAPGMPPMTPPEPPMLHDVTVTRTQPKNRVRIDAVPPEEFLISREAKTVHDAQFVGHRVERSISDLRAAGYKNVDDIGSDGDAAGALNAERIERRSFDDEQAYSFGAGDTSADDSQRRVWVTECYIRCDRNGDGIAELLKVVRAGGVILEECECDAVPFVTITPIPLPHRFFGLCPADQAVEPQKLKTSLLRASLDGLYTSINGRTYAVDNQVNLDDLMTSRPGGVVRVRAPGMVGPLMEGKPDLGAAQAMLEYAEVMKENRTGFTRYSQGTSADSLNDTATGMNIITNRADSRVELIARVFAETGFQDLFRAILRLVSQHQDQATVAQVHGKWVNFDPREWRNQFDFSVNVGLGTGNKDQQVQHLMALLQTQMQMLPLGLVQPTNLYKLAAKLSEALGFKQAEQFFTDPANAPPKPPAPPPPEVLKAQADQQRAQAEMQMKQAQMQADQQEAIARLQMERQKMEAEMHLARERLEAEIALKREQAVAQMGFDQEQAAYQRLHAQSEQQVSDKPAAAPADATALLGQLVVAMNPPKRKRMSITAPSGQIYHGEVTEEPHMPDVMGNEGVQ